MEVVNSGREVVSDTILNWGMEGPDALLELTSHPNWTGKNALHHTPESKSGGLDVEVRVPFLNPRESLSLVALVAGAIAAQVVDCRLPGLKVRILDGPYVPNKLRVVAVGFARSIIPSLISLFFGVIAAISLGILLSSGGVQSLVRQLAQP